MGLLVENHGPVEHYSRTAPGCARMNTTVMRSSTASCVAAFESSESCTRRCCRVKTGFQDKDRQLDAARI